ncbi:MAG: hypothetical protein IJH83_05185 [Coriobacteriales bacterium]|nr:hypothetical protein [Coriobacteriales bacterium]
MIISHGSAWEFWRFHGHRFFGRPHIPVPSTGATKVAATQAKDVAGAFGLSLPVHVLTTQAKEGSRSASFVKHVFSGAHDLACVVKVARDLYVVCPELCFQQMACHLTEVSLVRMGYELCGTYMPSPGEPGGIASRPALSTPPQLRSFIDRTEGAYPGAKLARRALRYVLPGSNSPAETVLSMLLTLPYRLGGFKLPFPSLNASLKINAASRVLVDRNELRPDLLWRERKVAVEYDSKAHHSDYEQREYDECRRNAMQDSGILYLVITKAQLKDPALFRTQADIIARALGKRVRIKDEAAFSKKHLELRGELASWLLPQAGSPAALRPWEPAAR